MTLPETIAVICKTTEEAHQLYERMKKSLSIRLIVSKEDEVDKGVMILPAYVAKGLEFDAVIVYNVSHDCYANEIESFYILLVPEHSTDWHCIM